MANNGHFVFRCLPKSIGTSFYSMSEATSNMKLIGAFFDKVIECTSFFIIFSQNGRLRPFWFFRFAPKSIGFFHSMSSMAVSIMNLIRALVSQLRETQALACGGVQNHNIRDIISCSRTTSYQMCHQYLEINTSCISITFQETFAMEIIKQLFEAKYFETYSVQF